MNLNNTTEEEEEEGKDEEVEVEEYEVYEEGETWTTHWNRSIKSTERRWQSQFVWSIFWLIDFDSLNLVHYLFKNCLYLCMKFFCFILMNKYMVKGVDEISKNE